MTLLYSLCFFCALDGVGGAQGASEGSGVVAALLSRGRQLAAKHEYLAAERYFLQAAGNLSALGPSAALANSLDELADTQGTLKRYHLAAATREMSLASRLKAGGGSASATDLIMAYAMAAKDLKGARDYSGALASLERARAAGERAGGLNNAMEASLLSMESELRDCTGEEGPALAAFEQAAVLRGAAPTAEEQLMHLDLLRKALRARPAPPAAVAAALQAKADAVSATLLAEGPWERLSQLPRTYLPGLYAAPWHEHSGPKARWPELTAPMAAALSEATQGLLAEFRALERAGRLLQETECVHIGHSSSGSKEQGGEGGGGGGSWEWAATNGFWQELDGNGCARDMPAACALLSKLGALLPELRVMRAGYSSIDGRAHLRPHCGWTNKQLKMHLALRTPKQADGATPCASIRVGNETRSWEKRGVLFFDDSFEHEVVHECSAQRVVFQLVFAHPDLPKEGGARSSSARRAFRELEQAQV